MKKLFCLFMCLVLTVSLFILASCNQNDGTGEPNSGASGSSEQEGVGTDSTVGTSDESKEDGESGAGTSDSSVDDSDESDGETTETSKNEGVESETDNSSNADSSVTTDNSGSEDNKEDADTEKITVSFVCFMYEPVSGETEIKIDKGSVLLPEQMPVYERKGYVMVWSYDRFGEEKWQPTDVFENDTELYGTWQAENLFDELKAKLSGLTNFQMNSAVDTTMGGDKFTHITVNKYDGEKVYMEIHAEGMVERVWYVDGACYMEIEGKIVEQEMSRAEFDAAFGSEVVGEDSFFGIKKDWVKSIKREGIEYTIELDAEKYTESKASDIPVELVYSSVKFIFTLDVQGKNLSAVRAICSFTQDGVPVTGDTQSEILNIGTTVVEAPVKE